VKGAYRYERWREAVESPVERALDGETDARRADWTLDRE